LGQIYHLLKNVELYVIVLQYVFFIALLEEYLPDKQTMKELLNFKFSHYLDNPEEEVIFQVNKSINHLLLGAAVLRNRDVYPGSEFFHPGSRV
jgi:hypothetical protein